MVAAAPALLFPELTAITPQTAYLLRGFDREAAKRTVADNHYTRSVPSGKSHYVGYETAIVIWSIPANMNIGRFLFGRQANVWELSRLWAPDGHRHDLLTEAISAAVGILNTLERPEAIVAYADPSVGHRGFVYRAASWMFHGQSEESRRYFDAAGQPVARRAFHSGSRLLSKAEITALGYIESKGEGKLRYVRTLTKRARTELKAPTPASS